MSGVVNVDPEPQVYSQTVEGAVCTLFEGNYHHGVAALLNSLHAAGFRGDAWLGFRGELPEWLKPFEETREKLNVAQGIRIRLCRLDTPRHLTNYKPTFLRHVLDSSEAASVSYFDPDITVQAPWRFFEEWIGHGVALCEDSTYARFPPDHPIRLKWLGFAKGYGFAGTRVSSALYNAGFVGVSRCNREFIDTWSVLLNASEAAGAELFSLKSSDRTFAFQVPDQDTLNVAAMVTNVPLSTAGPDAMGFIPAGFIMQHAVDSPKPWNTPYIRRYLQTGVRPSEASKSFWANVDGPFRSFDRSHVFWKRSAVKAAIALGRFYRH